MLNENKIICGTIMMSNVRVKPHLTGRITQRFTLRFIAGKEFQNHRSRLNVITDADVNVSFDDSEIPDYQTISHD